MKKIKFLKTDGDAPEDRKNQGMEGLSQSLKSRIGRM